MVQLAFGRWSIRGILFVLPERKWARSALTQSRTAQSSAVGLRLTAGPKYAAAGQKGFARAAVASGANTAEPRAPALF